MPVLLVAAFITLVDQWTKQVVRDRFGLGESLTVIEGFFDLTHIQNTGAAWGMMKDRVLFLIVVSLVMIVLMGVYYRSLAAGSRATQLAFGLLLGGIIGNLMDRIRLSAVTDFLYFHIGSHYWPAFNTADSAICVGVGIYLIVTFRAEREAAKQAEDSLADPADSPAEADAGSG